MSNKDNPTGEILPFKVYRLSEAAEALQVDRAAIYKAIKENKLPDKKIGKGYKFLGEDLLRFMGSATFQETSIDKVIIDNSGVAVKK